MDGHKPIPIHDLRKANALENKDQWLKWRKEGIGGSDKYENLVLVLANLNRHWSCFGKKRPAFKGSQKIGKHYYVVNYWNLMHGECFLSKQA